MSVDLDTAKAHLNITIDEDDEQLERLIPAAQDHLESQLGFKIADEYPDSVPAALDQAVLMLVGHWYESREASVVGTNIDTVPMGFTDIVNNHRNWSWV